MPVLPFLRSDEICRAFVASVQTQTRPLKLQGTGAEVLLAMGVKLGDDILLNVREAGQDQDGKTYFCEDAETVMIGLGSVTDDVQAVARHLRSQGK